MRTVGELAATVLRHGPPTDAPASDAARAYAASGAMALTGRPDGQPLPVAGTPAWTAAWASDRLAEITGAVVDGPALLGERAALLGFTRQGESSCGGGTRLLPCADGWCALNLARGADLVPALTGHPAGEDPWAAVADWAAPLRARQVVDRATLLGLAAARLGETPRPALPWRVRLGPTPMPREGELRVVNLGSLWAGPLAAHLLALAGARVEHIESVSRPDPGRLSTPAFYDLVRSGATTRFVDVTRPGALRAELTTADVVIEASRPRALRALGADADAVLADGRPRIWLRITGHSDGGRASFGDDAAVAGGLVAWEQGRPRFAGDAIADPLTGLLGGLAVAAMLDLGSSGVLDMNLSGVAAYCTGSAADCTGSMSGVRGLEVSAPRVARRRPATRPASQL
jgi:hypothetical protein